MLEDLPGVWALRGVVSVDAVLGVEAWVGADVLDVQDRFRGYGGAGVGAFSLVVRGAPERWWVWVQRAEVAEEAGEGAGGVAGHLWLGGGGGVLLWRWICRDGGKGETTPVFLTIFMREAPLANIFNFRLSRHWGIRINCRGESRLFRLVSKHESKM